MKSSLARARQALARELLDLQDVHDLTRHVGRAEVGPQAQDRAHGKIGLLPHCVERGRGIVDVAVASLDGPEATLDRVPLNGPRDLDPIVRLIGPQAAGAILTASASGNQRRSEPNNEPGHHRPLKR